MMFTLNSMFILVTLINKTAKLNLQVKEVLVVQAKKDTSELVKKKEEVTQVRNGGKKGTLPWQQWTYSIISLEECPNSPSGERKLMRFIIWDSENRY